MSTLHRARIVPAADPLPDELPDASAVPMATVHHSRRVLAAEALAHEAAEETLAAARAEAAAILAQAKAAATGALEEARAQARLEEASRVAALYLALKREDERRAERDLDRAVTLAIVLAERLLGAALERDPPLVMRLAEQALAEARGARSATILASPLDIDALPRHLEAAGVGPVVTLVRADPSLGRGSLRIVTNLGTLDAELHPQLERLARALRDTINRG